MSHPPRLRPSARPGPRLRSCLLAATGAAFLAVLTVRAGEPEPVAVPNASFESPVTPFVSILITSWQKAPKPPDYNESGGRLWTQLAGVFKNTAPGSADHIDNCDGAQALYLFAIPEVSLFLDGTEPGGAWPVTYVPGEAYTLTAGLIGGGGNMAEGASLAVGFHYLDAEGRRQPVAATNVVHTQAVFPVTTRFVDFQVTVPPVPAGAAWAGQRLGLTLRSTTPRELEGGYWDVDNIRLTVARPSPALPATLTVTPTGTGVRVTWRGLAGQQYQAQTSTDLTTWTDRGPAQPGDGGELLVDLSTAAADATFVRVLSAAAP